MATPKVVVVVLGAWWGTRRLRRCMKEAVREFSDPRYAFAREAGWQRAQAEALRAALRERGVAIWPESPGELPEELCGPGSL